MSATAILRASSAVTFAARAVRRASARVGSSPPWRASLSPRYIHLLVFSDGSDPPRLGDAADLPPPPSFAAPSARREARSPISRRHRREVREEGREGEAAQGVQAPLPRKRPGDGRRRRLRAPGRGRGQVGGHGGPPRRGRVRRPRSPRRGHRRVPQQTHGPDARRRARRRRGHGATRPDPHPFANRLFAPLEEPLPSRPIPSRSRHRRARRSTR